MIISNVSIIGIVRSVLAQYRLTTAISDNDATRILLHVASADDDDRLNALKIIFHSINEVDMPKLTACLNAVRTVETFITNL